MDNQQPQVDGAAILPNVQPPNINPPANAQANNNAPTLNRIQARIPPFWKINPALWFRQIESQFITSGITSDLTKYHTVVGVMESDVLSAVSDIVLTPPAINPYNTIKERLIERFADSEHKKLKNLLHDLSLGDQKPSDLLRKMRELSSGLVGDDLLKKLWLQRLPQHIQAILSTSEENLTIQATMADKISEVTESSSIQIISEHVSQDPLSLLNNKLTNFINQIENKVDYLSNEINQLSNSRGRSKFRNRSSSRNRSFSTDSSFCWYHNRFGSKATKCDKPCNFSNKHSKNYSASQERRLTPAEK